jgi:cell division protein FtsQ
MPSAATAGLSATADRHFRRSDVRPGRRRRVGQLIRRASILTVAIAAAAAAASGVIAWVVSSPMFQVDRLRVRGAARLSGAEIETLLSGLRGRNILAVDLEHFRRRALESPWVAAATLSRVLPSTVDIEVTERVPIAIARFGGQLYLVDGAGVIVDEFGPDYREFDLPIVDGLIAEQRRGGPAIDPARLQVTTALLAALAAAPAVGGRVSQVDVADARDVVVLLDDDPARLHLGHEAFVERLQRYLELAPALRRELDGIDYVDLRFGDRVFARAQGRSSVQRTAAR